MAPLDIYNYRILWVPASSQKTLNPELQSIQNQNAVQWASQYAQQVPMNLQAGIDMTLQYANPELADAMMIDPNQAGPQGQPPIYQLIQQLYQMMQDSGEINKEQDREIEGVQKLSVENADKIQEMVDRVQESKTQEDNKEASSV